MIVAASNNTAGPLGLLIVLLIGVSLVLLIRNMNARLRRLPPSFDDPNSDSPSRHDDDGAPSGSGPPSP